MSRRLVFVGALILSFLALARGMVLILNQDPLADDSSNKAKKERKIGAKRAKGISFYPRPPATLPDLSQGYLFNAERNIKGAEGNGQETGAQVNIDTVVYSGSLVMGKKAKAILSYAKASASKVKQRQQSLTVSLGDTVSGYTVSEILPDKIIFSRGSEKIEKLLHDPNKQRTVVKPSSPVARPKKTQPRKVTRPPRPRPTPRRNPPMTPPLPPPPPGAPAGR